MSCIIYFSPWPIGLHWVYACIIKQSVFIFWIMTIIAHSLVKYYVSDVPTLPILALMGTVWAGPGELWANSLASTKQQNHILSAQTSPFPFFWLPCKASLSSTARRWRAFSGWNVSRYKSTRRKQTTWAKRSTRTHGQNQAMANKQNTAMMVCCILEL